jgi:hypothetical protein
MAFVQLNPRTIPTERNDCVVRALTIALNRSYDEMHAICGAAGRKPNQGMLIYEIEYAIQKQFIWVMRHERVSFARFAKQNPVGRFVVVKRGHAVALVDGVWYDSHPDACGSRNKVMSYCRVD